LPACTHPKTGEVPGVVFREVTQSDPKDFRPWTIMADGEDRHSRSHVIRNALARKKIANVKQIKRVLPVERCEESAGKKIRERHDLHLGDPEAVCEGGRHRTHLRCKRAASQGRTSHAPKQSCA
jgi:hypothetical protein